MTLRSSSVRLLCRAGLAALLAGGVSVVGAPAAAAAVEDSSVASVAAPQSETGWVEEVRADSADSTKAVAGTVVVLVAGCISAVAIRPRRTPPAEG